MTYAFFVIISFYEFVLYVTDLIVCMSSMTILIEHEIDHLPIVKTNLKCTILGNSAVCCELAINIFSDLNILAN